MKIAITGAGGFIGEHVVAEALSRGHHVLALVRSSVPDNWPDTDKLSVVHLDLMAADDIAAVLRGHDIVVHLAAIMSGDSATQYSQTIQLTKNLLAAMDQSQVKRLIAISSIAVLDYVNQKPMTSIDESVPLNQNDAELGSYALMKRDQESMYEAWLTDTHKSVGLLRPGIVYDQRHLSTAHAGFAVAGKTIAVSHGGYVPLVHVESVAQAVVSMIDTDFDGQVLHLTDDNLPTQAAYYRNA